MSFIDSFYGFNIEVSHLETGLYYKGRLKVPRHPFEDALHLFSRILAYAHCYEAGLKLGIAGTPALEEGDLFVRSVIGEVTLRVEVGHVDTENLQKVLRRARTARHFVYFYEQQQVDDLVHHMRGSTTNWVAPLTVYQIPGAVLEQACELPIPEMWSFTFVEQQLYLRLDQVDLEAQILEIDLWALYQQQIGNV